MRNVAEDVTRFGFGFLYDYDCASAAAPPRASIAIGLCAIFSTERSHRSTCLSRRVSAPLRRGGRAHPAKGRACQLPSVSLLTGGVDRTKKLPRNGEASSNGRTTGRAA
jgi:hypothetical protein